MDLGKIESVHWTQVIEAQNQFTFDDESKVVAWLRKNPCPVCGNQAYLMKLIVDGIPMFQVCCLFNPPVERASFSDRTRCSQEPIPNSPLKDARLAVRAWTLVVSLSTK